MASNILAASPRNAPSRRRRPVHHASRQPEDHRRGQGGQQGVQQAAGHARVDARQVRQAQRHEDRDYAAIWKGTPFTEFIPLKPLVAEAGADVNVVEGRSASLSGRAKGGDGNDSQRQARACS